MLLARISLCLTLRPYHTSVQRVPLENVILSSSLLLQQCTACLVRLICIVFEMGGMWPYSLCFWNVASRVNLI